MPEDHPGAGNVEVDLADLAEEQWVGGTGDGCFGDCFAAACARAGFTPRRMLETDIRGCVDMVESGSAVGHLPADLPAAGRTGPPADRGRTAALAAGARLAPGQPGRPVVAPQLMQMAVAAYQDSVARNPMYVQWLRDYPQFGGQQMAAA